MELTNRCPVCQAKFRGSRICSRCGADLGPLMLLAVRSWRLREAARSALAVGQLEQGAILAGQAQALQWTQAGKFLQSCSASFASAEEPA